MQVNEANVEQYNEWMAVVEQQTPPSSSRLTLDPLSNRHQSLPIPNKAFKKAAMPVPIPAVAAAAVPALEFAFSGPCSVAVDVMGRIAVVDYNDRDTYIRVIEPAACAATFAGVGAGGGEGSGGGGGAGGAGGVSSTTATVRTLTLVDGEGEPAQLAAPYQGYTNIAIDCVGNIIASNSRGVHIITNTGLAPGHSPWYREPFWSPTATIHAVVPHAGKRAVRAVLLTMGRSRQLQGQGQYYHPGSPELRELPVMPEEMWIYVLGMLPLSALGAYNTEELYSLHPN
jgi:hypothetical protein